MPVDPPRPRPAPLNALRAFESAARLGGFARAAAELAITPGAVSGHVRALEDWAGLKLFERQAQGVVLTRAGASVLAELTGAFDTLGRVTQRLRATAGDRIRIAALPAIAQLWLAPRLRRLRIAMPGVEISVTALERPPDLLREPFTLALFLLPEGEGTPLVSDALTPLCTPELAARLHRVEDLATLPCLHDLSWSEDWRDWLAAVAPGTPVTPGGPGFSLYAMAVDEALAGAGILMGHTALLARHMAEGRLVAPFGPPLPNRRSLAALTPPGMDPGPVLDHLAGDI